MNFQLATMLVQVVGFFFFIGIIIAVVFLIAWLFKIRNNTTEINRRLQEIERKLDGK